MEYYKEELYRKEIFIVSGENNILGQEFEYGEEGYEGKLAIYSSGTTSLDENVTVTFALDHEAIGEYNKRNFDTKFEDYALELPEEYHDRPHERRDEGRDQLRAAARHRPDRRAAARRDLLHPAAHRVRLLLHGLDHEELRAFEILRKNDYATTKSDTYYTMTGTTQSGWVIDNIFGSDSRRQAINSSKLVTPVGKHSIRILLGATAETEALDIRNNSIRITVDPETWVNVPIYVEGELTDETVPMQKVTIEPYLDSQDAISVSASPTDVSALRPRDGNLLPLLPLQVRHRIGQQLAGGARNDDPHRILNLYRTEP